MENEAQSYIYLLGPDGYQAAYQFIVQESKIAKYVLLASADLVTIGFIFGVMTLQHVELHNFLLDALGLPASKKNIVAAGDAYAMSGREIELVGRSTKITTSPTGLATAQAYLNSWSQPAAQR